MEVNIEGDSLEVREFKLEWMCSDPAICMIAKRGSGKSWVCRDLLRQFKHIPGGIIIAPTDKMNCFYGKFFPDLYIHYEYKSDIIDKLLYRQGKMISKMQEKALHQKKVDPRAFLLMDDCLSTKGKWMKETQIQKIFFDGRHYKVMFILTMQFPLGITPELRGNFDYIFLLSEDFKSNQKRLYEHYAGMFPNLATFVDVFNQLTDDFGCMVIVNRGTRKDFLDKVFWYKATNEEINNCGNRQFRKYHEMNYDDKWMDNEYRIDANTYITNKARTKTGIKIDKVKIGDNE